jgi:hypothetical protein
MGGSGIDMEIIDFVEQWKQSVQRMKYTPFLGSAEAEGTFDFLMGTRAGFARVRLRLNQSESPTIVNESDPKVDLNEEDTQGIMFGVMDVLFAAYQAPLFGVKVTILEISERVVESYGWTFRLAARIAARKIFSKLVFPVISNDGFYGTVGYCGDFDLTMIDGKPQRVGGPFIPSFIPRERTD